MSEVNADGTLVNPQIALLQEAHLLTNGQLAPEPVQFQEEDKESTVTAGNGATAGTAGGIPHMPVKGQKEKSKTTFEEK